MREIVPLGAGTLVIGCAAVLFLSCRTAARNDRDDSQRLEELTRELQALIQPPSCSSVTVCRVIPVGAKPCGGPWRYVAYSTVNTDSIKLANVAARLENLESNLNKRTGLSSDCSLVSPPVLDCVAGTCAVSPPSAGVRR